MILKVFFLFFSANLLCHVALTKKHDDDITINSTDVTATFSSSVPAIELTPSDDKVQYILELQDLVEVDKHEDITDRVVPFPPTPYEWKLKKYKSGSSYKEVILQTEYEFKDKDEVTKHKEETYSLNMTSKLFQGTHESDQELECTFHISWPEFEKDSNSLLFRFLLSSTGEVPSKVNIAPHKETISGLVLPGGSSSKDYYYMAFQTSAKLTSMNSTVVESSPRISVTVVPTVNTPTNITLYILFPAFPESTTVSYSMTLGLGDMSFSSSSQSKADESAIVARDKQRLKIAIIAFGGIAITSMIGGIIIAIYQSRKRVGYHEISS